MIAGLAAEHDYACVVPNLDNTPRALYSGLMYNNSTPELNRSHLRDAIQKVLRRPLEQRITFV